MRLILTVCLIAVFAVTGYAADDLNLDERSLPFEQGGVPDRPEPVLELGEDFLGAGELGPTLTLPTGAIWQPSLLFFGTYRSAVQSFDDGVTRRSEWANRLDVFGNLRLSGTERILVGFRPLDKNGNFAGYTFEPDEFEGSEDRFDGNVETLFFEGDFGEIFPELDRGDFGQYDIGFSVGRQPLLFQEGILINDTIDSIGVTRNSITFPGVSNARVTALFGWDEIDRNNNSEDNSAFLYGLFAEADLPKSTVNFDFVYVSADEAQGDGFYSAASAVQRLGRLNSSFRIANSIALDDETDAVSDGTLLFGEFSFEPVGTHNLVYLDAFWGFDQFSSAARGPATGGPLGRTGLLFSSVGLGNYGSPLSNRPDDTIGAAIGYQLFTDEERGQFVFEFGGREGTRSGTNDEAIAFGARWQRALDQRFLVILDAFIAERDSADTSYGGRFEFQIKA